MRCMATTKVWLADDTPHDKLEERLGGQVRQELAADVRLKRVVEWSAGIRAQSAPGMMVYNVVYETEPRD
jgi:hypothetical protein